MISSNLASPLARTKSSNLTLSPALSLLKHSTRLMASVANSIPHAVRTANDPRQADFYDVTVSRVEQVNPRIRLLRLSLLRDGVRFETCHTYSLNSTSPGTQTRFQKLFTPHPLTRSLTTTALSFFSVEKHRLP